MTIAVAGKGGSGKTTISGILARSLGKRDGRVLAIDGDTNPNLALTLGLPREQLDHIAPLTSDLLEQYTDENGKNRMRLAVSAREVIDRFGIDAPDSVRLVMTGRVNHAGAG